MTALAIFLLAQTNPPAPPPPPEDAVGFRFINPDVPTGLPRAGDPGSVIGPDGRPMYRTDFFPVFQQGGLAAPHDQCGWHTHVNPNNTGEPDPDPHTTDRSGCGWGDLRFVRPDAGRGELDRAVRDITVQIGRLEFARFPTVSDPGDFLSMPGLNDSSNPASSFFDVFVLDPRSLPPRFDVGGERQIRVRGTSFSVEGSVAQQMRVPDFSLHSVQGDAHEFMLSGLLLGSGGTLMVSFDVSLGESQVIRTEFATILRLPMILRAVQEQPISPDDRLRHFAQTLLDDKGGSPIEAVAAEDTARLHDSNARAYREESESCRGFAEKMKQTAENPAETEETRQAARRQMEEWLAKAQEYLKKGEEAAQKARKERSKAEEHRRKAATAARERKEKFEKEEQARRAREDRARAEWEASVGPADRASRKQKALDRARSVIATWDRTNEPPTDYAAAEDPSAFARLQDAILSFLSLPVVTDPATRNTQIARVLLQGEGRPEIPAESRHTTAGLTALSISHAFYAAARPAEALSKEQVEAIQRIRTGTGASSDLQLVRGTRFMKDWLGLALQTVSP